MISLAILAGGKSERMGTDKGLLPFVGKPLIQRVVERLVSLTDDIFITTDRPDDYTFLHIASHLDLIPGYGPLGGLYTSLEAAKNELVAVVACDMPFANPDIMTYARDCIIQSRADVAIPSTHDGLEPLHAIYRRASCLPVIRASMELGERKLIAWLPTAKVRFLLPEEIIQFDPKRLAFMNLNTPEEIARAEKLAGTESAR